MASPEPFIRPYNKDTDFKHLAGADYPSWLDLEQFRRSLECPSALATQLHNVYFRWIFRVLYVELCPEFALVLDDGTGRHVGHIVGAADTEKFVAAISAYAAEPSNLDPRLFFPAGSPQYSALPENLRVILDTILGRRRNYVVSPEVSLDYPAHLHIEIDSEFQGKGWGRKLVQEWESLVHRAGAKGVNLGMPDSYDKARLFYLALGYTPDPKGRLGYWEVVKSLS